MTAENITEADLALIQGFSGASFEEVTNNIRRLVDVHSSSKLENFKAVINDMKLKGITDQNNNAKQGMYWTIRDIANNQTEDLIGKTLKFEFPVPNSRPTNQNSRIDVFCSDCDPILRIEHKSGTGSISSSNILSQFIERDLFGATSLDQIQWRMDGTEFSSSKLKDYMKSKLTELNDVKFNNPDANTKLSSWFETSTSLPITDSHIDKFVNSHYSSIFK